MATQREHYAIAIAGALAGAVGLHLYRVRKRLRAMEGRLATIERQVSRTAEMNDLEDEITN
jgi:Tfp pilus assembly protein PilO